MRLKESRGYPIMCLTRDGLALSHVQQAQQLCAAGARWVQLRMKNASTCHWVETARQVVSVCRSYGAVCIVNDSVDVALAAEADGVHLGRTDEAWKAARQRLGRGPLIGGTVNNEEDAARALDSGGLDYVGVGPWRFTTSKEKLSPVLGEAGVRLLVSMLDGLPCWVIGGIEPADLPTVRTTGAAGVAISAGLFCAPGTVEKNYREYEKAWEGVKA